MMKLRALLSIPVTSLFLCTVSLVLADGAFKCPAASISEGNTLALLDSASAHLQGASDAAGPYLLAYESVRSCALGLGLEAFKSLQGKGPLFVAYATPKLSIRSGAAPGEGSGEASDSCLRQFHTFVQADQEGREPLALRVMGSSESTSWLESFADPGRVLFFEGLLIGQTLWLEPGWAGIAAGPPEEPSPSPEAGSVRVLRTLPHMAAFTLGSKQRRLENMLSPPGATSALPAGAHEDRLLAKLDGAIGAGSRTVLLVRAKFAGQDDSAAISGATLQQLGARLADTVKDKSYGAAELSSITYGGASGANCLYELDVPSTYSGLNYDPIRTVMSSLQRQMQASNVPAGCSIGGPFHSQTGYVPNSLGWSHVIVVVPLSPQINYAGTAWRPGSQFVLSMDPDAFASTAPSDQYVREYYFNSLFHELLHNMGLGHANVIDAHSSAVVEYGDGSDSMGSMAQLPYTTDPLSMDIGAGYKHGLGWLADSRMADFSYASLVAGTASWGSVSAAPRVSGSLPYGYPYSAAGLSVYGSDIVLGALERRGLRQEHFAASQIVSRAAQAQTSLNGSLSSTAYFDLSFRIPDPQRIPNRWLYASYRSRSSTARNAIMLSEITQNWGSSGGSGLYADVDSLPSSSTLLGESYLFDVVPSTKDQGDADLDPAGLKALVYEHERDTSSTARKWLITTKGSGASSAAPLQLTSTASLKADGVTLTSADLSAVSLKVQPLSPSYERFSGRGCTLLHGCQPQTTSTPIYCGSTTTISLNAVQAGRAFKVTHFDAASTMVTIQVRSLDSSNGVAVGVYASSFPAAQVLYGADVSVRAVAYSNFSILKDTATGGHYISNTEVTLTVPMSTSHDYSFAVVSTGPREDELPALATVSVTCSAQLACSPINNGLNGGINLASSTATSNGGGFVGNEFSGYYGIDPVKPIVTTADKVGYLSFAAHTVGSNHMRRSLVFSPSSKRWELQYYREFNNQGVVATKVWNGALAENATSPLDLPVDLTNGGITCACPKNSYLDGSDCKSCPAGMVSKPGSTSSAACVCDRGWTYSVANGTMCTPAPLNTFKTTVGNTAAKSCPISLFSPLGSQSAAACRMPAYDTVKVSINSLFSNKVFYRSDIYLSRSNGAVYYNASSSALPPHPANGLSNQELELRGGRPVFYANASSAQYPTSYYALYFTTVNVNNVNTPAWAVNRFLSTAGTSYFDYGYSLAQGPPHTITSIQYDNYGGVSTLAATFLPSCSVGTYHQASGECRITPAFAVVTGTTASSVASVDIDSYAYAASQAALNPVSRCPEGYRRFNAGSPNGCMACSVPYHVATEASGGTVCACPAGYSTGGGGCSPPSQLFLYFNDGSDGFGLRGTFDLSSLVVPSSSSDLGYGFRWPEYRATVNRTFGSLHGQPTVGSADAGTASLYLTYLPWRREWSLSTSSMALARDASILAPSAPRFAYIANASIGVPLGTRILFLFSPSSLDFEPVEVTLEVSDPTRVTASPTPTRSPSPTPTPTPSSTPSITASTSATPSRTPSPSPSRRPGITVSLPVSGSSFVRGSPVRVEWYGLQRCEENSVSIRLALPSYRMAEGSINVTSAPRVAWDNEARLDVVLARGIHGCLGSLEIVLPDFVPPGDSYTLSIAVDTGYIYGAQSDSSRIVVTNAAGSLACTESQPWRLIAGHTLQRRWSLPGTALTLPLRFDGLPWSKLIFARSSIVTALQVDISRLLTVVAAGPKGAGPRPLDVDVDWGKSGPAILDAASSQAASALILPDIDAPLYGSTLGTLKVPSSNASTLSVTVFFASADYGSTAAARDAARLATTVIGRFIPGFRDAMPATASPLLPGLPTVFPWTLEAATRAARLSSLEGLQQFEYGVELSLDKDFSASPGALDRACTSFAAPTAG